MPSNYIDREGLDLDDVFSPLVLVDKVPDVGYAVDGEDISNRYLPLYAGGPTHVTGYRTGGIDLNEIFGVFEGPTPTTSVRATISYNPIFEGSQDLAYRRQEVVYPTGEPVVILGDQTTSPVLMALRTNGLANSVAVVLCLVDSVGNPLPENEQPTDWSSAGYTSLFDYQFIVDNGLTEGWTPALPPGAVLGGFGFIDGDCATYTLSAWPTDTPDTLSAFPIRHARNQVRIADISDQLDQTPLDGSPFVPSGLCAEGSTSLGTLTQSWLYYTDAPLPNYATSAGSYDGWDFGATLTEYTEDVNVLLGYLNAITPGESTVIGSITGSDTVYEMRVPGTTDDTSDLVFVYYEPLSSFDSVIQKYTGFPFIINDEPDPSVNIAYTSSTGCTIPAYVLFRRPVVVLDVRVEPPSDT